MPKTLNKSEKLQKLLHFIIFFISSYPSEKVLKPCLANVPILYPLKIPENLWFSGVFKGYMGTLARNGLIRHMCGQN